MLETIAQLPFIHRAFLLAVVAVFAAYPVLLGYAYVVAGPERRG